MLGSGQNCLLRFGREARSDSRSSKTGMIKSSPQQIIADGTDWRFLDELKRELKT
ncbi:hypothetical protein [Mesorhizobium amorphae]|uniref:hypothetical protein n=1 Tax=Mesorhizobium amorphae TaxID=71433 RepID=UPI00177BBCC9|nr:hypothetical protein [Mesorhizobium amorphae]